MSSERRSGSAAGASPAGAIFPWARWQARAGELAERWRRAEPFPHLHLPDFLAAERVEELIAEFPSPGEGRWIEYRHFNEDKLGSSRREEFPPGLGALVDELNSPRFVAWLEAVTGIRDLRADPSLEGGGLHQTRRGGFLNVHADFGTHPRRPRWVRRVNLILFLNPAWEEEWGGHLELWDRRMERPRVRLAPLANHAVLFATDANSYHGYPDPISPPPGVTRKSVAVYYFTVARGERPARRATDYRARPTDGLLRRLGISLDRSAVALYSRLKARVGLSDEAVGRWLARWGRWRR